MLSKYQWGKVLPRRCFAVTPSIVSLSLWCGQCSRCHRYERPTRVASTVRHLDVNRQHLVRGSRRKVRNLKQRQRRIISKHLMEHEYQVHGQSTQSQTCAHRYMTEHSTYLVHLPRPPNVERALFLRCQRTIRIAIEVRVHIGVRCRGGGLPSWCLRSRNHRIRTEDPARGIALLEQHTMPYRLREEGGIRLSLRAAHERPYVQAQPAPASRAIRINSTLRRRTPPNVQFGKFLESQRRFRERHDRRRLRRRPRPWRARAQQQLWGDVLTELACKFRCTGALELLRSALMNEQGRHRVAPRSIGIDRIASSRANSGGARRADRRYRSGGHGLWPRELD